ncbi:phytoene desaturase family protein [Streptomyces sp. NPDC059009]|uniref:phytoene desaturase family protein n=1 Tax=Streptomyces sp. NPDC059009 TaxID=3346694 RepID=UPI0036787681
MTRNEKWDAIVVGSGIGALVCAAYLAADGRKVLVCEQHSVPGGSSHVFRRRRRQGRYEFDVGTHYIGDCGPDGLLPAVYRGLGLADRVRFRPLDPGCFDTVRFPGRTLEVGSGWDAYRRRLSAACPGDADGIGLFLRVCAGIGEEKRAALLAEREPAPAELGRGMPYATRWANRPLSELFDHCGLSRRAAALLAAQSGNYGSPPSETTVLTHVYMLDSYLRGAYYPEGGGQTLSAALIESLRADGGEVRTRCRVERILVDRGRAVGVRLASGEVLTAPVVVSGADFPRTVLELAGPEHFPPALVRRTRQARMRMPVAVLYLGLSTPLDRLPDANIWFHRGWDIEDAYAQLRAGCPEGQLPFVFVSSASRKDPASATVCPPGHSNVQVMTPYRLPGSYPLRYRRDPGYRQDKERVQRMLLDAAREVLGPVGAPGALGPLEQHIVHAETSTGLTHERYTGSTGGTPYGLGTWGTISARPGVETAVRGLYVVGQSTRYGSGIVGTALSGIVAAEAVTHCRLLARAHRGAQLAAPARLPDRPADWDPVQAAVRPVAPRTHNGAQT